MIRSRHGGRTTYGSFHHQQHRNKPGTGAYAPDITITATGGIVSTYTAVYGSALISNAGVTNYGNISGTVEFQGRDTLLNHGTRFRRFFQHRQLRL